MKNCFSFVLLFICHTTFAQYNFYFGNLHSHTGYSDGSKDSTTSSISTPGDSYAYTKKSYQMNFLGITEHNHYTSKGNPGMLVANYAKGLNQADTANEDGKFVAFFGFEWGVISGGGHVVTIGIPSLVGWESGSGAWGPTNNYGIYCAKSNYKNLWEIVKNYPTAFCTLAHPQDNDFDGLIDTANTFNNTANQVIVGSAMRSGSAFSETKDYSDGSPVIYQNEYYAALAKGYYMGPTIDHDNHYTNFGRTNQARTVILSRELSRDSLTDALLKRRFYASDDWNAQVSFSVNGNVMGSRINTQLNSSISVTVNDPDAGDNVRRIDIYYGTPRSGIAPTILTTVLNSAVLNFTHTTNVNDSVYYFAKIAQADGNSIWTSPVWVKRVSEPVPVILSSFSAKANNTAAILNWTVEPMPNLDHFEVERSTDGTAFTSVYNTVYSENISLFSFTDENTFNGTNYYRIKLIFKDGKTDYSNTLAVLIKNPAIKIITVSPNPTKGLLNIKCSSLKKEDVSITIYNAEGREVKTFTQTLNSGNNLISKNVADLARGIYMFVLSQPNVKITEGKFIKL